MFQSFFCYVYIEFSKHEFKNVSLRSDLKTFCFGLYI